ncbi:MAG: hypothetical protein IJS33_00340 [Firmicutes bacterium]|nr:hypothetical protein [Bacillota bacterium]
MKKILTLMMVVLLVALSVVPAMAENYTDDDWTGSEAGTVDGKVVLIDKYFTMSKTSEVLDVTFSYEVTVPDADIPATDDTATVYAGIDVDKVKVYWNEDTEDPKAGNLHFSEDDKGTSLVGDRYGNDTDTKKTQKKVLAVDFSDITFTEPGIYRYYIQESSSSTLTSNDTEVTGGANTWRTIDVYVIDPETADHNVLVTGPSYSVVYVGKLTNAPKQDIDYAGYTPETFDGSQSDVITGTVWTYEDGDDKYTYNYVDGSNYPDGSAAWEETHTNTSTSTTETNRNRIDHLMNSYGTPDGKTYTPATYKEANDMGAKDDQLQGTDWTETVGDVTYTYHWDTTDPANPKWTKTGVENQEADAPHDDARATVTTTTTTSGGEQEMTYAQAKANENYIDGELTRHTWVLQDTQNGTTTEYTWNDQTLKWDVKITTHAEAAPSAAAAPKTPFNVSPVKYSYVYEQEQAAFDASEQAKVDANEGYQQALEENPNNAEAGDKTDNYVNEYFTQKLEISKTVAGNQGSRDKYFKYTIKITDAKEGAVIKYDDASILSFTNAAQAADVVPNAATSYTDKTMAEDGNAVNTYTVPASGEVEITIYLQHGQKLVLEGIPQGAAYEVLEEDYSEDGYKVAVELDEELDNMTNDGANDATEDAEIEPTENNRKVADTALMNDAAIAYTNTKTGVIPTGVIMSITGGAALIAIAGVGLFALNRRKDEDEE